MILEYQLYSVFFHIYKESRKVDKCIILKKKQILKQIFILLKPVLTFSLQQLDIIHNNVIQCLKYLGFSSLNTVLFAILLQQNINLLTY